MRPTLLILAAGLGSRYGGLKQIDRIGPSGERIIDYSVYDAVRAGFGKIVYVIRESFKDEFYESIIGALPSYIHTETACQEMDTVTFNDVEISPDRTKPWGTGHALLVAAEHIDEPFLVINADDFYGAESYRIAYEYLTKNINPEQNEYALIGYKLINTLSDYGTVSRGICSVDSAKYMKSVVERTEIKKGNRIISYKDEKENWQTLSGNEIASMNMFALAPSIFAECKERFHEFLIENASNMKAEFWLPKVISNMAEYKKAKVKIVETPASWFGLTYHEDKQIAIDKINNLVAKGIYPAKLWS